MAAALDEDVAQAALEVALEELKARLEAAEPRDLDSQLSAVEAKIARAVALLPDHSYLHAVQQQLAHPNAARAPRAPQPSAASASSSRSIPHRSERLPQRASLRCTHRSARPRTA